MFHLDTMSPNAFFEYAGDRDNLGEEDIVKDIEIQEDMLAKRT